MGIALLALLSAALTAAPSEPKEAYCWERVDPGEDGGFRLPGALEADAGGTWLTFAGDPSQALVRSGSSWGLPPTPLPPEGQMPREAQFAASPDGQAFAAVKVNEPNGASSIAVARWSGSQWTPLGKPLNSTHASANHTDDASLAVSRTGRLAVAWSEELHVRPQGVFVAQWDGSAWSGLTGCVDRDLESYYVSPALAWDAHDQPWVAYRTSQGAHALIRVARWDGHHWQRVGESDLQRMTLGAFGKLSLAYTARGEVWLAFLKREDEQLTLHLLLGDGQTWREVAPPQPPAERVHGAVLLPNPTGSVLLAWTPADAASTTTLSLAESSLKGWRTRLQGFHLVAGVSTVEKFGVALGPMDSVYLSLEENNGQPKTHYARVHPCGPGESPSPLPLRVDEASTWPKTVEEAASKLLKDLTEPDRATLAGTRKRELIRFHPGLGMGIRNSYGLWRGNEALLKSCGAGQVVHPDDCSMRIIEAAWARLQPAGDHPDGGR